MADAFDDRVERYIAGELSAPEERELARAALDDPALFDTLTAAALLRESMRGDRSAAQPVGRAKPRLRRLVIVGSAIAAAALISVVIIRRPSPASTTPPAPAASADAPKPAPRTPESVEPAPIFLTARSDAAGQPPSAFRSAEAGRRLPKDAGTVSSVDGAGVAITLGSLDGLAKGSTVRILGQAGRGPAATLSVDKVFRERSEGHVRSGPVPQIGDRSEVSPADRISALLQHADAREAAGDIADARHFAELAVTRAEVGDSPAGSRRRALADLGMLEHRAGALAEAVRHLRAAAGELDGAPAATRTERARVLSALGSALVGQRAYADAEPILRTASSYATGRAAVRIANNRAAIAAIRGDRTAAEALYQSALRLAGDSPDLAGDRRAIRSNLQALQSSR